MSIKQKMTEIFKETKARELKGTLTIEDERFIDFLVAYYVGFQIRYEGIQIGPNFEVGGSLAFQSMREFTKDQLKEISEGDISDDFFHSELKARERTYANIYNRLNPKTVEYYEERQKLNRVDKGFKQFISLFDFQKEKDFILITPSDLTELEEKEYKTHRRTIKRLQKANFKKIRIPHLDDLSSYFENLAYTHPDITEDEMVLHKYMIEISFNTEYYRAASRLLAERNITPDIELARLIALISQEVKSFRMKVQLLEAIIDKEWLTYVAAEERIASFIPSTFTQREAAIMELTTIKNLLTHCIMDFIEKGYFGFPYDEEDKEIYKSEFDKSWLTEVETKLRDKKAEAEKFNVLKEEITNFYSAFK